MSAGPLSYSNRVVRLWERIVHWRCREGNGGGVLEAGIGGSREEKRENEGMRMEGGSAAERHSLSEQADSAQQSKHTAGFPREETSRRDAATLSLLHHPPPPPPASLLTAASQ